MKSQLSYEAVKAALSGHSRDVWDAASLCLDTPSDTNLRLFKELCRPAEIMLLLRAYAEYVNANAPNQSGEERP